MLTTSEELENWRIRYADLGDRSKQGLIACGNNAGFFQY